MIKLLHRFSGYRTVFMLVILIMIAGIFGGFIAASGLLVLILLFSKKHVLELLLTLIIFTFFLGDNYSGPFSFTQNFRFVLTGVSIIYLHKYKLFENNKANYLLPFTIIAFGITLLLSPLGILAILRSVAFWLIALVIFKLLGLLYKKNPIRTSELLVLILTSYFFINIVLVFLPFLNTYLVGRFKGLAANPNGLALIGMFSYAVLELIRKRKDTTFKKNFFIIFKAALFFIIILTGSRTALFSVLIFEIFNQFLKNKVLLFMSSVLLAVLFVLSYSITIEEFVNMMGMSEYLRVDSLADASGRLDVWPVVWEEIKRAPWFGNGIMYDNYFIGEYVERYIGENAARQWSGVWSSYLSLLLDVGIIGILAYAYFWVNLFRKAQYKNVAIAFVVMCILSGITESWMAASMNAFTPMMFLFWAIQTQPVIRIKKKAYV
ncbi:O-antigen ligase family protein [Algibacter sp.]|nr:O-antigen ligase family protein [Algibacter sp.]